MVLILVSIALMGVFISFLYIYIKNKESADQSCGMETGKYKIDCFCSHDKAELCEEKSGDELLKIQKLTALDRDI